MRTGVGVGVGVGVGAIVRTGVGVGVAGTDVGEIFAIADARDEIHPVER